MSCAPNPSPSYLDPMKKDHKQNYDSVLLEDINSKFDFIVEVISSLTGLAEAIRNMDQRLGRIEAEFVIMKSVLIEHPVDIKAHESRITKLETNAFN